jgi:4,5-dihydroxyphthalate decarboxylase
MPAEEVFFRALRYEEFDIAEMSMGRYTAMISQGDDRFVAIPVFPSRMFRHSSIYVRADRGIDKPADLKGKTIGVPEWAQTAGIYVRGLLTHRYDLRLQDMAWVQAGIHETGREEEVAVDVPAGVRLARVRDRTLNDMLLRGEIDAVISAHPPECTRKHESLVRRLFGDFQTEEREYFRTTGIFPIMHTVILRRPLFEANRWIANNLLAAFTDAKDRSIARLREVTAARVPLPWGFEYARQAAELFGDDFWPYGVNNNRTTLDAFLQYALEQGVAARPVTVDDLFPREVRHRFKI